MSCLLYTSYRLRRSIVLYALRQSIEESFKISIHHLVKVFGCFFRNGLLVGSCLLYTSIEEVREKQKYRMFGYVGRKDYSLNGLLDCYKKLPPVSYTHLDVYKRQVKDDTYRIHNE